ncbi:MAG: dTMP kinase [Provencibacterium sp.]|nr:dTMP kinase [Provencibacterium sp.]
MFITIDGPDGTGKTTLAHKLAENLQAQGLPAVYTCEPTDSELGRRIRTILREGGCELGRLTDLFVEDRAGHIRSFIEPCCRQGQLVICDRYKYSTICYQHLQGEPIERLLERNRNFLAPDLAVILCTNDAGLLLERIGRRGLGADLFESRKTIENSIALYRRMPEFFPEENFHYIDSKLPLEETAAQLSELIRQNFSAKKD